MKRVVVELEGNLVFCGIDKGYLELDGKNGLFVETDQASGLKVWCPEDRILEKHDVVIEE